MRSIEPQRGGGRNRRKARRREKTARRKILDDECTWLLLRAESEGSRAPTALPKFAPEGGLKQGAVRAERRGRTDSFPASTPTDVAVSCRWIPAARCSRFQGSVRASAHTKPLREHHEKHNAGFWISSCSGSTRIRSRQGKGPRAKCRHGDEGNP